MQMALPGLGKYIDHRRTAQVPTLEQNGACAQCQQIISGLLQRFGAVNAAAQQQGRFVQVGRDHRHQRKKLLLQHLHCGRFNQAVTAGGHHHRIEHDLREFVVGNSPGHHAHDLRRMQHTDLDCVHADVFNDSLDLRFKELRRDRVNTAHAKCVLRRQCRDGRHAVAAQGAESFEVGLDAGTATAVRAGDRQDTGVTVVWNRKCKGAHVKIIRQAQAVRWAPQARPDVM